MDEEKSKGALERFTSSPSAVASLLVAVLGQALFSIYFQVVNNEQQSAQLASNALALKTFQEQVNNLQTPLSQRVFKLEDKLDDYGRRHEELSKRIDGIDLSGTRALSLVVANQQRVMGQIDRLGERMIMMDKKVGDLDLRAVLQLQNNVEGLNQNVKRLNDQVEELRKTLAELAKLAHPALPQKN